MKRPKGNEGAGRVWSSQHGELCARCERPLAGCVCARQAEAAALTAGDGIVRVGRETKGRKGAGVTVVRGVRLGAAELAALARELKRRTGSGGTVREGVIELQGDHRDLVVRELEARGLNVRRAGG